MKQARFFTFLMFLLFSGFASAQVSGVSTDKLAAFNAATLPVGQMELEPTFSYSRSLGFFDQENSFRNHAGIIISSALSFRVAYGLGENLEVGANFCTQSEMLGLSAKYFLLGNDKIGFGVIGGINSDMTNGARALSSITRQYVLGITSHYNFTDILSLNTSIQFQDSKNYLGSDLFLNSEVGYYIYDELMLVAVLGLSRNSNSEDLNSSLLSFFPGFNYEKKMFVIALQSQFDLTGKNSNSNNGVSISITQLLE